LRQDGRRCFTVQQDVNRHCFTMRQDVDRRCVVCFTIATASPSRQDVKGHCFTIATASPCSRM
jgi:hypothetical protein